MVLGFAAIIGLALNTTGMIYAEDTQNSESNKMLTASTSDSSFTIEGHIYLDGRKWKDSELPIVEIDEIDANGSVKDSTTTNSYGLFNGGARRFSPGYIITNEQNPINNYHYRIRLKKDNYNSVILDSKEVDIYIKSTLNTNDNTRKCTYSLDGVNYLDKSDELNIEFHNTYFTRTLSIERKAGDATYELYTYINGDASVSNPTAKLVKSLTTVDGKLSEVLEEGKYFLIETKAPEGYEQLKDIIRFDVTAANYKDPLDYDLSSPAKEVEPKDESIKTTPKTEVVSPKAEDIPTGDHTNLAIYMATLIISAFVCLFARKRKHSRV